MKDRVHLAGTIRPFALCQSFDAMERHTKNWAEVTCPFCSALFLADHPELRDDAQDIADAATPTEDPGEPVPLEDVGAEFEQEREGER